MSFHAEYASRQELDDAKTTSNILEKVLNEVFWLIKMKQPEAAMAMINFHINVTETPPKFAGLPDDTSKDMA